MDDRESGNFAWFSDDARRETLVIENWISLGGRTTPDFEKAHIHFLVKINEDLFRNIPSRIDHAFLVKPLEIGKCSNSGKIYWHIVNRPAYVESWRASFNLSTLSEDTRNLIKDAPFFNSTQLDSDVFNQIEEQIALNQDGNKITLDVRNNVHNFDMSNRSNSYDTRFTLSNNRINSKYFCKSVEANDQMLEVINSESDIVHKSNSALTDIILPNLFKISQSNVNNYLKIIPDLPEVELNNSYGDQITPLIHLEKPLQKQTNTCVFQPYLSANTIKNYSSDSALHEFLQVSEELNMDTSQSTQNVQSNLNNSDSQFFTPNQNENSASRLSILSSNDINIFLSAPAVENNFLHKIEETATFSNFESTEYNDYTKYESPSQLSLSIKIDSERERLPEDILPILGNPNARAAIENELVSSTEQYPDSTLECFPNEYSHKPFSCKSFGEFSNFSPTCDNDSKLVEINYSLQYTYNGFASILLNNFYDITTGTFDKAKSYFTPEQLYYLDENQFNFSK